MNSQQTLTMNDCAKFLEEWLKRCCSVDEINAIVKISGYKIPWLFSGRKSIKIMLEVNYLHLSIIMYCSIKLFGDFSNSLWNELTKNLWNHRFLVMQKYDSQFLNVLSKRLTQYTNILNGDGAAMELPYTFLENIGISPITGKNPMAQIELSMRFGISVKATMELFDKNKGMFYKAFMDSMPDEELDSVEDDDE